MSRSVHLVMQGKGGVGKSVVARLIAEYMIREGQPFAAFDADPVNQTFGALKGFGVEIVELLKAGNVDPSRFDPLIERAMTAEAETVIIDTGAAAFLPLLRYIDDTDLPALMAEQGVELFFHTIVTGGPSFGDTFGGFRQMASRFGEAANVIVWVNGYFGEVGQDGQAFAEIAEVKKLIRDDRLTGIVTLPEMSDLPRADFAAFLKRDTPFARVKEDDAFNLMSKSRLHRLGGKMFDAIGAVIGEPADAG